MITLHLQGVKNKMQRFYLGLGIGVLCIYAYAEFIGWKVIDSVMAGSFRPVGRSSFHK